MKDYIVLEINGKKECLGIFTINTPNEYLLVNNIESIVNNRIFEEFIDKVFLIVVNKLVYEVNKKINNVYITFLNDDKELICSIVIDKFRPRKNTYRMRAIDWQVGDYTLQYIEDDLDDVNATK